MRSTSKNDLWKTWQNL